MRRLLPFCLLLQCAWAQGGFGYAYEIHDTDTGVERFDGRLEMGVHRISVIDTGGILAASLGTMARSDYAGTRKGDDGKYYDYWWVRPVAPIPGGFGRFEFAFCGSGTVTESGGESPSFWEVRLNIGDGGLVGDNLYYQLDALDLTYRSLTGSTGSEGFGNDQFAVYVGLDMGLVLAPGFVGGYVDYDWFGGFQSLLGDEQQTYAYGLEGGLGAGAARLTVRYGWYQWSDTEGVGFDLRTMAGTQWTFSLAIVN